MKFRVGDKVQIILQEQTFYMEMYRLSTYIGTISRVGCGGSITYITVGGSKLEWAILSKDLKLVKNQQLLFEFMT